MKRRLGMPSVILRGDRQCPHATKDHLLPLYLNECAVLKPLHQVLIIVSNKKKKKVLIIVLIPLLCIVEIAILLFDLHCKYYRYQIIRCSNFLLSMHLLEVSLAIKASTVITCSFFFSKHLSPRLGASAIG